MPGFYAVLSSRPIQAITSNKTLKTLGIGLANVDFGRVSKSEPDEETFRSAVIRLKEKQSSSRSMTTAWPLSAAACSATVTCRSMCRSAAIPPMCTCSAKGKLSSKNQSTLEVTQGGFEQTIYRLAFTRPLIYGVLAVLLAVLAGLAGWAAFRREPSPHPH